MFPSRSGVACPMAAPPGFRCAGLLPCAEAPVRVLGQGGRNGGAKLLQIYRFLG